MSRESLSVGKPWEKTVAFSLGVVSTGRLLHTAGITARDPNGALVGVGNIRAQIEQCFRNVGDVLRVAGADFDDVVKWTMYTTDIDGFSRESDLWLGYFKDRPASTLVEVRRLVHPDMLVEIEAIAVLER
jgi:enamine deaminase RidA (YjgF/YER057c/UK114 family)